LCNAIGSTAVAELFGVEEGSDEFAICLAAYEAAACEAWIEAKEAE
jgi:hypothetical protein